MISPSWWCLTPRVLWQITMTIAGHHYVQHVCLIFSSDSHLGHELKGPRLPAVLTHRCAHNECMRTLSRKLWNLPTYTWGMCVNIKGLYDCAILNSRQLQGSWQGLIISNTQIHQWGTNPPTRFHQYSVPTYLSSWRKNSDDIRQHKCISSISQNKMTK